MISILAVTVTVTSMVSQWLMAQVKLKAVYWLGIVNGCLFTLMNGLMAAEDHAGVALLIVPSAWMIFTCVIGLRKIRKFEQDRKRDAF